MTQATSTTDLTFTLELPPYDSELIDRLFALTQAVFETASREHLTWRLTRMPDLSTFAAWTGRELVGFKTGYAMSEIRYYSWLGGVHPDYRRRGLASELMRRQHQWAAEGGFASIETATNQDNHAMAQVNLAHGMSVCGVRIYPERSQILFSRSLG